MENDDRVQVCGLNFNDALNALIGELRYQGDTWSGSPCITGFGGGAYDRSVDEYTLYIQRYANRMAKKNGVDPDECMEKIHLARKIAALAIACLAEHGRTGTMTREDEIYWRRRREERTK